MSQILAGMVVLLALGVASVQAAGPPQRLFAGGAARRVHAPGVHDLRGQPVRCAPGEQVGLWVDRRVAPASAVRAAIGGCEVGVLVTGGGAEGAVLQGLSIQAVRIGMWLAGNGGDVSENLVGEADYGVVITGDDYRVARNVSQDNRVDGYLITGDRNLVEGNEARRNGGTGLHVASTVPLVGTTPPRALRGIVDQAVANVIRGNTALQNRLDLRDSTLDCDDPYERTNEWSGNTFATRDPACLQ